MYACMHVRVHVCMHACMCACMHVCACARGRPFVACVPLSVRQSVRQSEYTEDLFVRQYRHMYHMHPHILTLETLTYPIGASSWKNTNMLSPIPDICNRISAALP
jgi:hypothetical protein